MTTIFIGTGHLKLETLAQAARDGVRFDLDAEARARVASSRAAFEALLERGDAVYGANTGFGLLSDVRIPGSDVERLQENLIRSHCAGTGDPFPVPVVRIMMVLRAAVLARGHSAVRPELIDSLLSLLNAGITPCIPSRGSVGASGDLTPLAHLSLAMMGEGDVFMNEALAGILPQ